MLSSVKSLLGKHKALRLDLKAKNMVGGRGMESAGSLLVITALGRWRQKHPWGSLALQASPVSKSLCQKSGGHRLKGNR